MEMFIDVLLDAAIDCMKMLPFLFLAFLLIEALEHYSSDFTKKLMVKVDKAGPVVGAIVGCVPQCGFSVMAANLYSGGIITVGTLIAVFLATSDEAILIIMGNPEHAGKIGVLLLAKVIIAIIAGYLVDIFFKKEIAVPHHEGELCHDCGCHNHSAGIVKPALRHTGKIFLYLFVFTFILNLCIDILGIDKISAMMLGDTVPAGNCGFDRPDPKLCGVRDSDTAVSERGNFFFLCDRGTLHGSRYRACSIVQSESG